MTWRARVRVRLSCACAHVIFACLFVRACVACLCVRLVHLLLCVRVRRAGGRGVGAAQVHNKCQRIFFECSSPNGILLFREARKGGGACPGSLDRDGPSRRSGPPGVAPDGRVTAAAAAGAAGARVGGGDAGVCGQGAGAVQGQGAGRWQFPCFLWE